MTMAHMGYRIMTPKDFDSWDDWVKAVNDNDRYCASLPCDRAYEWRGKCNYWEVPSSHPYWARVVLLDKIKREKRHIENLRICEENPEMIKMLYNLTTTLKDIRAKVAAIPSRKQKE